MNIENFSFFFYFSRNNFCLASSEMLNAPSSTLIFLSVVSVVNPKTHPKQFKIASLNELLFSLNIYKYANYIFTRMRAYYDFFESIVSENSSINGWNAFITTLIEACTFFYNGSQRPKYFTKS